ncbi:drug/metabolite transporter (DMT)-like permease [Leucobacter exalbidus]|uniref:Drug/metabolite transporter (DMT)-like permease n=1 Tax=Leucobacter exalbidus TaxID=662960 RepID=A0A940T4N3_9MICO|nr:DMT family transporter [Leucobacter exalbidus]MBP1325141.1 drug/metabolite transporter (DMT)-like permease [Leucobacter exalbidus]
MILAVPALTALTMIAATANGAEAENLSPHQFLGIPVALLGAAFLAFGAQYQSRGLNKVERLTGESAGSGLSIAHMLKLVARPSWVIGTLLLGLAVLLQIGSLSLSPLIVVQPIGVVGLVITSVLNSKLSGVKLGKRAKSAIGMCVAGTICFVTVAAFTASDRPVTDQKLIIILVLFGIVFIVTIGTLLLLRRRAIALLYIVGAGVLYGFVATFAKAVIGRVQQGDFDLLTWLCVAALLAGALVGMVYVQNAYSSGPPDLVVAGLTVIDPLIAVLIGIVVLNEAAGAPGWAIIGFIVTGIVAVVGVIGLARYHPQTGQSVIVESTAVTTDGVADTVAPATSAESAAPAAGQTHAENERR